MKNRLKMKKIKIKIEGKRIFLRTLRGNDATKKYCGWLNDPQVTRYLATKRATIAGLKKYIQEKNESSNSLFFGIFLKQNRKHIGTVKLEPINFKESKATVGIMIGDKNYWGKGLAPETIKLLIDYAFQKLKLKEVNLGVISENKAAIRAYQKVGFKVDRINKKSVCYGDRVYDNLIMSVKFYDQHNKKKKQGKRFK